MDPFQTEEASTPSPQNNGSGDSAQSVSSDDFVKVENSSERLLDLDFGGHGQTADDDVEHQPQTGESIPSGDLLSGEVSEDKNSLGGNDDDFLSGHDNAAFKDSPVDENVNLMGSMEPEDEQNFARPAGEVLREWQKDSDDEEEFLEEDAGYPEEESVSHSPKVAEKNSSNLMDLISDEAAPKASEFGSGFVVEEDKNVDGPLVPQIKSEPEPEPEPVASESVVTKPVVVQEIKKEEKPHKMVEEKEAACSSCVFSPGVWFDKERLSPKVADLLYWKDVKKTGIAFGGSLLVLLSLAYFSLISVIAYSSLALLGVTMSFRIYKSVITAVQKSNEGHPFKDCLDKEFSLSPEKVRKISDFAVDHTVSIIKKTKSLFLVEDIVDSLKFGLVLWCLTYIGAWFNGMTLLILAFVSAFTLPKVYETNQTQIDHYLGIAMAQVKDVMDKVKAKVPMLNKKKEE